MKSIVFAAVVLVALTAVPVGAGIGFSAAPTDHYAGNRAVLVAAWVTHVDLPLDASAIRNLERIADATRAVDLSQGTPVHAGRLNLQCVSPSTGCNVDPITALPADQCITANHIGPPGYAHQYVNDAATAWHSDQLIANHAHDDAFVAGAICVRDDTSASNSIRVDGVGVFL